MTIKNAIIHPSRKVIIPLAGLAIGLCATVAMSERGDPMQAGDIDQPVFNVTTEGPEGDTILQNIVFSNEVVFTEFIYAVEATEFDHECTVGTTRLVAGPNTTGTSSPHRLGNADGDSSGISPADMEAFESDLIEVFQNVNLNNFIDNKGSSPWFTFVLELEKPVKDNDSTALDAVGEIIFFERGAQIANSFLLLEAIDGDGNTIGTPVLVNPDRPVHTTPESWVGVFKDNLDLYYSNNQPRTQEMGAVSVDLNELGVTELTRLRVSRPTVGENGLTNAMLAGSPDLNPDFKLIFVQTYDVIMPSWATGD